MIRSYTRQQVMDLLHMKRKTFERRMKAGDLPFVEVLQPVIPNHKLYRADLLDRYLAGEWGSPRHFTSHKKHAPRVTPPARLGVTP